MPTIALRLQQDGFWRGWTAPLVGTGVRFGYEAVDDSDGVTHDSAATTLRLARISAITGAGRVSFPLFLQAEGLVPVSITLNVVAQKVGVISHPRIRIGFYKSGLMAFAAAMFDPPASFSLAQRTFSTNPITGNPWSASDLIGLEACLESEDVPGSNDVTLISGSLDYYPTTNSQRSIPWAQPVA